MVRIIKEFLNKYGVNINRIKYIDIGDLCSRVTCLDSLFTYVISMPIDKNLRTYRGVSLGNYENDPYVLASKHSFENFKTESDFTNNFVKIISKVVENNRSMSEAFRLSDRHDLKKIPECFSVLPWSCMTIDEKKKIYIDSFCRQRGFSNSIKDCGVFYSNKAWVSHAEQFYKLISLIKKNGFRKTSLPVVNIMHKDGECKYIMSHIGNHRMISAFIVGVVDIDVRIGQVIDIKDVNNWKNVKNGLYSKTEARGIFLDYFNGIGYGSNV
jgi:hypothetical protein